MSRTKKKAARRPGRPRLSMGEETARFTLRIPESWRAELERQGGDGTVAEAAREVLGRWVIRQRRKRGG